MSNERSFHAAARDAGVRRIRSVTRGAVVGATLLSGVFAGLAMASTHVRKTTHAVTTRPARRSVTSVPTPVPSAAPSSAEVPAPAAPAQAPTQSSAPPVVSSGGS
jgi:hypothetical protein